MTISKFVFTITLTIAIINCDAQTLHFQSYTTAQGLSQNSGYSMAQDGQGYLWMGTQDGLNRFNGKSITNYFREKTQRGRLPDNLIRSLYYDSANNFLWIGTAGGLSIYNCRADSFYPVSHYFKSITKLDEPNIRSVCQGRSPFEIIVITFTEGLYILNTTRKTGTCFFQDAEVKSAVTAAVVWNGHLMATVNQQLYTITDSAHLFLADALLIGIRKLYVWQNKLIAASTINGVILIENFVQPAVTLLNCGTKEIGTFCTDNNNRLWIGTRNAGIVVMAPDTYKILYNYNDAINQVEWPAKFTLSLFKDRQLNIWVGSSGGGFTVHHNVQSNFGLIQKPAPQYGKAAHNMILSLYKPDKDLLYMGTQLEGMRIYNAVTGSTETISNNLAPLANSVYTICKADKMGSWLATPAGLFHFNSANKRFTHYIDTMFPASGSGRLVYQLRDGKTLLFSGSKGSVWFDIINKNFRPFVASKSFGATMDVGTVMENDSGLLWLSTQENGLVQYNLATHALISFPELLRISKTVHAVMQDGESIWLGTANGLIKYNIKTGHVLKHYSTANGLPGNTMYSVEKDSYGNVWCGTNAGLIKINTATNEMTQIKASAGLQGDEFNSSCSTTDSAGHLYFGGINGVSWFHPANVVIDSFSPKPIIEAATVLNTELQLPQNISYTNHIQLSPFQNFITIRFGVNNFTNHDECQYRYRMQGADTGWVLAGNRNEVNYSGLQPGNYQFCLQSANATGVWSRETTCLSIDIQPAWWQTGWFTVLVILLTGAVIFLLVKRRIAYVRYEGKLRQQITETEMAALKAQMNPHFMFNCINSIDAFIQTNDKYNATLYLNKFAKLIRNVLDSSKQNVVAFTKDAETLRLYIELEELRSESKFTTQFDIDSSLLNNDYQVPPLIIQPFVENAIIHGLRNREGDAGVLKIAITNAEDAIIYQISDNGIGRQAAEKINTGKEKSYGMQMSYDRVRMFNKEDTPSVTISDLYESETPTGTLVIVHLKKW